MSAKSIMTTLLVALLVQPASAVAHSAVLVPPGDSASSQYVETVPTDRGGALPGSGTQPNALTPSQGRRLAALGPDGRTLAAVVEATSPPPVATASGVTRIEPNTNGKGTDPGAGRSSDSAGTSGPSGSAPPLSAAGTPSTASIVLAAATGGGGGGLGIFLPLLLLASALGVILHAVVRWRTRTP